MVAAVIGRLMNSVAAMVRPVQRPVIRPCPVEFLGNRDLEHPETGAEGKADHQDDTARNQLGGEQGGFGHEPASV